jgi:hypothetical protein
MSATGQYQIGSSNTNNIYVSTDYGVNWNPDGAVQLDRYRCVAISATGQYRVGVRDGTYQIQISRNYGSSYSSVGPVATWTAVAISSTGQYVSAITNTSTAIHISSNYGVTWSAFATDSRSLGITYGKDASGVGLWVATAGRRDRDFAATSTNTMAYSYDGKLWRGILASACMSHQAWSVAYGKDGFGAGMWVAGGYDVACGLKWSYDGIIWNAALGSGAHGWASMAVGRRVTSVYWNGSIWYASTSATSNGEVSDGGITASGLVGYLLYSYNGKNWLPVLSNSTTAFNNVNTRTIYSSLPNSCILDFGSLYDDQSQRGTTITNTNSAGMIGPVYSGVPPKNVNTIVPFGSASKTTGQVPFLMGGDSGLVEWMPKTNNANNAYNAYENYISGPTAQSTNNNWQYFKVNQIRSVANLLSNWQLGNDVISTYGQWNGDGGGSTPFVQKVTGTGLINGSGGVSFNGPALVIHPENSDNGNVGIGYKNNTGNTIIISVDISLSLLLPGVNSDGVNYYIQRGLVNDSRYQIYVNSIIPANSTYTYRFYKDIELLPGEIIYLILNRNGAYVYDHTRVEFNVIVVFQTSLPITTLPITSELAATTTSLSTSMDGGITWRGVPNSVQLMTKVNKIMCDENTQQIVAVGTGNYSVATSTPAMCDASNGWVGVFGSRMTNTKTGLFDTYGTGAAWFSGAKMWIAGGRARTRRGSSLAVSVNGTVWQDAKIVSRAAAGAGTVATAGRGGGLLSRSMTSSSTFSTSVETMLYPFTTFTFTPGGSTGRYGPPLAMLRTAYSSQPGWTQLSPYLNMSADNGIQQWTVPATGIYTIRAAGAAGGNPVNYCRGIDITTSARLNKGEVIFILVGQQGGRYNSSYGQGSGGGGTFVVRGSQTDPRAIIVAGGGGGNGQNYAQTNSNAVSTTTAQNGGNGTLDGYNGAGGTGNEFGTSGGGGNAAASYGAAGGGLTGQGGGIGGAYGGNPFVNGGIGGGGDSFGGFGGGGGSVSNGGGGGGGGYSGGGGGYTTNYSSGGGGGSYAINAITNTVIHSEFPGKCIITLVSSIPSPALSIFSTSTFIASSVIPYTTPTTSLLTYTDSATAFSTQVGSVAVNSHYNRAVVGGSSVQFVAGGRSGAAGAGAGDISNNLAYSYDGLNWTPVSYSSGLAGSGSGSIFQTPTNVATYTYAGGTCGLDASFGTIALTPRYTNTNQLSTTSVRAWFSIAISKTGQYQLASVPNEYIYISSDYGQNWTPATAVIQQWGCVAISYSGQYQMVIQEGLLGFVWISNNYGVSWAQTQTNGANIKSCAISGSGQYQTVTDYTGTPYILISSNYGINWARAGNSPIKNWASISMSETGQYMIAMTGDNIKEIWRSADYGNSWSLVISGSASIGSNSASISPSGQYQTVSSNSGGITSYIYIYIIRLWDYVGTNKPNK